MKKNFLLSMIIMLMTTISSFAQKEYNMVITLNNGTNITLGHNDIKEITFNDGQVSISGNVVNTIDSIANAGQNLENIVWNRLAESEMMIKQNQADIDKNQEAIAMNLDEIKACKEAIESNHVKLMEQNDKLEYSVSHLMSDLDAILSLIQKYHSEATNSKEYKTIQKAFTAAKKK